MSSLVLFLSLSKESMVVLSRSCRSSARSLVSRAACLALFIWHNNKQWDVSVSQHHHLLEYVSKRPTVKPALFVVSSSLDGSLPSWSLALSADSKALSLTGTAPSQFGPPHFLCPGVRTHRAPPHPEQFSRPGRPQTCIKPQHGRGSDSFIHWVESMTYVYMSDTYTHIYVKCEIWTDFWKVKVQRCLPVAVFEMASRGCPHWFQH